MRDWARGLGAVALGLALGCGESAPPPTTTQRSMVPEPKAAADRSGNRPPVVERVELEPRQPVGGQAITAKVEASDVDGDRVVLHYTWTLNGDPAAATSAVFPAGIAMRDDRVEVSVVASDGLVESSPMAARANIGASVPQIRGIAFDPYQNVKPGDTVTALVDVGNEDDSRLRLSYRWLVNGEEMREDGRSFPTQGLRRGDRLSVEVTAFDGDEASDPVTSGEIVLSNAPPKIKGIPTAVQDGDAFRYQFEAEDPDGDRSLRFALSEAPAGMTIDPIYGLATWRPTKEQAGNQTIEVSVRDSTGAISTLRFAVAVTAVQTPAPQADGKPAPPPAKAAPAKAAPAEDADAAAKAAPAADDDEDAATDAASPAEAEADDDGY